MDQQQLKQAIGKPQALRLKQIGGGIKVGEVLGSRVLVKTVTPRTEMDRVEEAGLIAIPKFVKKENTPLPTTGVVLIVGPGVPCKWCGEKRQNHEQGKHCLSSSDIFKPTISEGDMVMFPKFSGCDFNIEEEDLRILEVAEVMCTLVDSENSLTEVAKDGE
jgi:co-chaperonin GroES (HSP10)